MIDWARRHGISSEALAELAAMLAADGIVRETDVTSEARVQSNVRLLAAEHGAKLWRNNVGVLTNEEGRPVRYGLANDSPALNKRLKSGDLIGWRRRLITPDMIGTTIAQFASRECKPAGWKFTGTPREKAQAAWAQLVTIEGGDARFTTGEF